MLWWILAVCVLVVVPVLLRLLVGDEEPDNAIRQEQQDEPKRDPDETLMSAA